MTADAVARHHETWSALPEFPAWPYVMTDEDVEAWGDILYMRGLVDDLLADADTTATDAEWVVLGSMLARPRIDDQDIYLQDWSFVDDVELVLRVAADELKAWRAALDTARNNAAWWLNEVGRYNRQVVAA